MTSPSMTPSEKHLEPRDEKLPSYSTESFSTWHDLAGHWLRAPAAEANDVAVQARRLAAVQRWRGLTQDAPQY